MKYISELSDEVLEAELARRRCLRLAELEERKRALRVWVHRICTDPHDPLGDPMIKHLKEREKNSTYTLFLESPSSFDIEIRLAYNEDCD